MGFFRSVGFRVALITIVLLAITTGAFAVVFADRTQEPIYDVPGGDVELARQAMEDYACYACHTIPGVERANTWVGPPLTNWGDRTYIAGSLPNDPDNLISFIVNPQEYRPDTAMPVTGISPEEAAHIAAYLYTLYDD